MRPCFVCTAVVVLILATSLTVAQVEPETGPDAPSWQETTAGNWTYHWLPADDDSNSWRAIRRHEIGVNLLRDLARFAGVDAPRKVHYFKYPSLANHARELVSIDFFVVPTAHTRRNAGVKRGFGSFFCRTRSTRLANWLRRATTVATVCALDDTKAQTNTMP